MARLIYLPAGKGAKKQGVDDYLSAGHTVDELLEHATSDLKNSPHDEEPEHPYRATPGGLVWEKPTQNGSVPTPLTNFTARIKADVSEDDGAEVERSFEIEAMLSGRHHAFTVPARQFPGMGWVTEHLGAGAIVQPGFGVKDHARAAIQTLSVEIPARRVYAHTGWRKIGGEWLYLHAHGAVGMSAGDEAHRPRQHTGSRVKAPSAVVPWPGQSRRSSAWASSASAPIDWQASARHTCSTWRPAGSLRKWW